MVTYHPLNLIAKRFKEYVFCRGSSGVEQLFRKQQVVGSNPILGSFLGGFKTGFQFDEKFDESFIEFYLTKKAERIACLF